ncbi:MAG: hypothetical protein RL173_402 [Fibrobacterota bacterium]|jgi:hypothetical protein
MVCVADLHETRTPSGSPDSFWRLAPRVSWAPIPPVGGMTTSTGVGVGEFGALCIAPMHKRAITRNGANNDDGVRLGIGDEARNRRSDYLGGR